VKIKGLFTVVAIILLSLSTYPSGNENSGLKWYSFEDGIRKSMETKKKILMDVFTDWCGWCKKMDNSTYSDTKVISYMNEKYIPVKLDAESKEKVAYQGKNYTEQQLSRTLGVSGYPATVFFDNETNLITVVPGYIESKDFLNIIKFLAEDIYKTKSYEDYLKSVKD